MNLDTVVCADALDYLRTLPDESVNCIITSPPYYGLRDYGADGQLGLEDTPEAYVARLVAIFAEARRVLRADGTCWIVLGDSFWGGKGQSGHADPEKQQERVRSGQSFSSAAAHVGGNQKIRPTDKRHETLKPKDLVGIPFRVAFALQADGWWLRSDIIWAKGCSGVYQGGSVMPESVRDRPTHAHEYVFLLTRNAKYWYDAEAIKEEIKVSSVQRAQYGWNGTMVFDNKGREMRSQPDPVDQMGERWCPSTGRNRRSVWVINPEPTSFVHFATFPQKLIEPMVLAGCPARVCATCGAPWERVVERSADKVNLREGQQQQRRANGAQTGGTERVTLGVTEHVKRETIGFRPSCTCDADTRPGIVLDPFMGSGTTALVARRLGRHFLGCDVNAEYVALANERLAVPYTLPMFV